MMVSGDVCVFMIASFLYGIADKKRPTFLPMQFPRPVSHIPYMSPVSFVPTATPVTPVTSRLEMAANITLSGLKNVSDVRDNDILAVVSAASVCLNIPASYVKYLGIKRIPRVARRMLSALGFHFDEDTLASAPCHHRKILN
jgi:hypothetical protein